VFETAIVSDNVGWYMEMAANLAWCHRYPFVTSTMPDSQAKVSLMKLPLERVGSLSLRRIATEGAGSVAEYCQLRGTQMALPESSMVLIESALLSLNRRITVAGIARALTGIAIGAILVFTFALIKLRWPILFAGACTAAALYLTALLGSTAMYSQYRMMVPTMLFGIGVAAIALSANWHRRVVGVVVIAFVMGVWTVFAGNLRTSLYPSAIVISLLFFAGAALDVVRSNLSRRRIATLGGAAAAAFVAGILAFDVPYFAPQRTSQGYSYHVAFHSIVIGLAVPPNPLTTREHIEWIDGSGLEVARRVDPSINYLADGYDRALSVYYLKLWRQYPSEMVRIYIRKMQLARQSAAKLLASDQQATYWFVKDGRWMTLAAWPAEMLAAGITVVGLFTLLFVTAAVRPAVLDIDLPRGFLLAAVASAVLFNFAESVATVSDVVLQYSNIYLFGLMFTGLFVYQSLIDFAWRRWGLGRTREAQVQAQA